MKHIHITLIILFFAASLFAQGNRGWQKGMGKHHERLEQLEKIKIIEVLNLDEKTTMKFFARRDAHLDEQKKVLDKRIEILEEFEQILIEDELSAEKYTEFKNKILDTEQQLFNGRKDFLNSLDDLLNKEQIAKLILFEFKFKNEIRGLMQNRREMR
ncbi:MAG: hypothetical protein K9J16_12170 [Melioribacteraceae bacterium]|nr:hypothetical protein [Melioribacteraceae bacterium]MCF8354585.1 hypothetical protein [Melioribacteraceae bacterium]MCF8394937.1 hypothetical protein [Melioribacteraceae bacterium]MCF8420162.1 hypothetical protein [Melioribacteraceae bacterium]